MTQRIAVVTGASSGIGAATARELSRLGFRVVCAYIADAIGWVATRPAHVNIDELVIKPRAQAAHYKIHRVN